MGAERKRKENGNNRHDPKNQTWDAYTEILEQFSWLMESTTYSA